MTSLFMRFGYIGSTRNEYLLGGTALKYNKRVVVNPINSLVTIAPMCVICLPTQYRSMQSSSLDKINDILSLRTAFIITSAT